MRSLWLTIFLLASTRVNGFAALLPHPFSNRKITLELAASRREINEDRRKILVSRNGSHFMLDRLSGMIEFGAAANLYTKFDVANNFLSADDPKLDLKLAIEEWLQDERGLALSIWDPKLMKEFGNVYRLQIMSMQFVTLQLTPWVDVQMKTVLDKNDRPVFTLQSVNFEPNLQVLPGMRVDAEMLGIVIEVAGEMRTQDGQGVTGTIAFQTSGSLPPPLRLLPELVLKAASDTINQTIVNFAIRSFQNGSRKNFQEFLLKRSENKRAAGMVKE